MSGGAAILTKRHADGSGVGAALGDDVVHGPVEAVQDDGRGAGRALEDLDGDDGGLLGDTVGRSANGASNVSAVAVGISIAAADGVVAGRGTANELVVSRQDARVDNVGIGAASSRAVVDVARGARSAVRDGAQTPGSASLRDEGGRAELIITRLLMDFVKEVPDLVRLDIIDLVETCLVG